MPCATNTMQKRTAYLIGFFVLVAFHTALGQETSTIDVVKVKAQYEKEAMYFYNENWKAFRELAFKKGIISGYELLRTPKDSTNHFELILITKYKDRPSFEKSEENFRPIMKQVSPNGPRMLNDIDRKVFLTYLTGYETTRLAASGRKPK